MTLAHQHQKAEGAWVYPTVAIGAVVILMIVVAFWMAVSNTFESNEAISAFGAAYGVLSAVFSGLALLGVIVAVVYQKETAHARRCEELRRNALDLYAEWHSSSMSETRQRVEASLAEMRKNGLEIPNLDRLHGVDEAAFYVSNAKADFMRVFHFWEKCAILGFYGHVDTDLLSGLLCSYIIWHHRSFLRELGRDLQDVEYRKTLDMIQTQLLVPAERHAPSLGVS